MKITQRVEAKADQNNPIICQAGFGQDSLSYTLCSSYSRWPKGWMDNDTFVKSAILDGCARFLPASRFFFSILYLVSRTSDRAGPFVQWLLLS